MSKIKCVWGAGVQGQNERERKNSSKKAKETLVQDIGRDGGGGSGEKKKKGLVVFGSVSRGCVFVCVKYSTKAWRYSRVYYIGQLITS